MKTRPIRKDLFRQIALAFSLAILVFSFIVYHFIIFPAANRLAEKELILTANGIRNTVQDYFLEIEQHLNLLGEYASQGHFVTDSPNDFQRFAAPLIKNNQSYYAFRISREDSREVALFKNGDGWSTRLTYPLQEPGIERWSFWDRNNLLLMKETYNGIYDCRNQPGFFGALLQQGANAAYWTSPYMFPTSKEYGISASARFTANNGVRYVLSLDTSVNNISALTRYITVGKTGFIVLFDDTGAIVGQPSRLAFEQQQVSLSAKTETVRDLPLITTVYDKWGVSGKTVDNNLFFTVDGVDWIARFINLSLGGHTYYVGLFVPVGDFPPDAALPLNILGSCLLLALIFSFLWTRQITDKISRPLQQLVAGSKKIGQLDFSPLEFTQTRWNEINELAVSHETMRRQIGEAAIDLEERITARTLAFQMFSSAIEQSPVSVIITDLDANIEYVNPYFCQLTGYTESEVLGKNPRFLQSGLTPAVAYVELWKTITAGNAWRGENVNKRKDGTLYNESTIITPILNRNGTITHYVAVKEDVTQLKKREEELRQARRKAEEATETKSVFLANMSHEIRTPMNAIIGLAYLALKTELTAKQYDYISKIHSAGASLLRIINDILDFSKIEAGKMQLDNSPFMLDEIMDGVFNLTHAQANAKGLEFLYNVASDIPQNLIGDPLRLSQILTNLINNAVKFTSSGSITVTGQLLNRTGRKVELQFSVTDTGIGMSQEQVDKLFQAFSQADASTTRKYGGTGLGLTISKRLIEMMGGSVWVNSIPEVGSTFSFSVWFELPEKNETKRHIVPEKLNKLRALVVDDNPVAREILSEYLKAMTFRVDAVIDGKSAIDAVLQCDSDPYELILMDWQMPEMDGIETARRIKTDQNISHSPVIVMVTSFDREEIYVQVQRYKLDGVLVKPIIQSHLLDLIMRLFAPGNADRLTKHPDLEKDYGLAGLRILLVEDNEINQQIAIELLRGQGVQVALANTGREAVEKVMHTNGRPDFDLILMDLQMPDMDGFEATKKIRGHFCAVPIIAMTARAMAEERESCIAVGMNDHVAKPIDPHFLFTTIARWTPKHRRSAPRRTDTGKWRTDMLDNMIPKELDIDMEAGLKRVAGNVNLYQKLLRQYLTGQADAVAKMRKAMSNSDRKAVVAIAHSLKGVSGNIGAMAIAAAAIAIEEALRNQRPEDEILKLLDAMEIKFTILVQNIHNYLPTENNASAPGHRQPLSVEMIASLRNLSDLLASNDVEGLDCFERMQPDLVALLPSGELKEMERLVVDFDWDSACKIITSWLNEGEG